METTSGASVHVASTPPLDRGPHPAYKLEMLALAIPRAWARRAVRQPFAWACVLAATVVCPLGAALSPLPAVDGSPSLTLLWAWSAPLAVLGSGAALTHLSRREAFLGLLAVRTRWVGESVTLGAAAVVAQLALLTGALVTTRGHVAELALGPWLVAIATLDACLAALGLVLLRLPLPTSARVVAWGLVLLAGAEAFGARSLPLPLDIADAVRDLGARPTAPIVAARLLRFGGWLALSAFLSTPHAGRAERGTTGRTASP